MCTALSLPRVRSAEVSWITRCCLLNMLSFDEFEKFLGNTKMLENNVLKLRTNMHLIDDPWR